jgi:hypothetical protein
MSETFRKRYGSGSSEDSGVQKMSAGRPQGILSSEPPAGIEAMIRSLRGAAMAPRHDRLAPVSRFSRP